MPEFAFTAQDRAGNTVHGKLEAESLAFAANKVGQMGYALSDIKPVVPADIVAPPPTDAASKPQPEDPLTNIEKRRKVEKDLATMGMSPEEIRRLLDAPTDTMPTKPDKPQPTLPVPAPPTPTNAQPARNSARQKLNAKATELESFAAQLSATVSAKRVNEIETAAKNLPAPREATPEETRKSENLMREAYNLRKREKYADALIKCREALELTPSDAPVLELYGDLLQGVARIDEALAAYKRATEVDPKRLSAERKYGDLMMRQKVWDTGLDPETVPKGPRVASLLSLLLPGAGQLLNGEKVKGFFFLAVVGGCLAYWILSGYDIRELNKKATPTKGAEVSTTINWTSNVPLLISCGIYVVLAGISAIDAYLVASQNKRRFE